uniref:Glycoside hydrolase family 13 N-terminal domain-containing protein n=1 Tax=Aegilops tauschii subsp. strangulata TaxID=200361 RepID=A0A453L0L1_AEGTS
ASRLGVAPGCGGGQFGKAQRFGSVRSTLARAQTGNAGRIVTEERESAMAGTEMPLKYSSGKASPLGVSQDESGLNFAIFSQHASSVTLCIKLPERGTKDEESEKAVEFALDCQKNKTGDIWHVSVEGLPTSGVLYGYRVNGPQGWEQGHRFDSNIVLLDPYAKLVSGRNYFGLDKGPSQPFGTYDFDSSPFDWGADYQLPNLPEVLESFHRRNAESIPNMKFTAFLLFFNLDRSSYI